MLKKLLNLAVLFVVVVAVFTPVSDSVETAIEMTIPTIIGIAITRLYFRDILTADNSAVRMKVILSAVSAMTALVLLTAVCMVEIEALDYTYIELDDAIMGMMIFGIIGVGLELVGKGVLKLIHRLLAVKSSK